jgi:hypothetical protein
MGEATSVSDLERSEHKGFSAGVGAKRVIPYLDNGDGTYSDEASKAVAKKITVSGSTTYIASAPIGTAQATAGWQAKKISVSGSDTTITWAGSGAFNQVATDLTSLSYA